MFAPSPLNEVDDRISLRLSGRRWGGISPMIRFRLSGKWLICCPPIPEGSTSKTGRRGVGDKPLIQSGPILRWGALALQITPYLALRCPIRP